MALKVEVCFGGRELEKYLSFRSPRPHRRKRLSSRLQPDSLLFYYSWYVQNELENKRKYLNEIQLTMLKSNNTCISLVITKYKVIS